MTHLCEMIETEKIWEYSNEETMLKEVWVFTILTSQL